LRSYQDPAARAWTLATAWTLALALAAAAAGCTQVTDLWGGPTPPGVDTQTDTAPGDAGGDAVTPDDGQGDGASGDVVDPACIPDPCAGQHRACVSGFCADCLPGYAEDMNGLCVESSDPCTPDPCAGLDRVCLADGTCGACLPGFEENMSGLCESTGDPCLPDPCADVHKYCVEGFCSGCLPGFTEGPGGQCLPPNPCLPNPCTEGLKTTCTQDAEGAIVCLCAPATHDDGQGGCTFDPCVPNPCADPFPVCTFDGPIAQCECAAGQLKGQDADGLDVCYDDPCTPNPCTEYAKTACAVVPADGTDPAALAPTAQCSCDEGFEPDPAAGEDPAAPCLEVPAKEAPAPALDAKQLYIDGDEQLFVDDWLVESRDGLLRRIHAPSRAAGAYLVGPETDDSDIGRARANGSVIAVSDELRGNLAEDNPLRDYPYWMFYMGYRQVFQADAQPAWLCLAVAQDPAGPWLKPSLYPDSPAPHCVLRDDGMVTAEVSDRGGWLIATVTRISLGGGDSGVYAYRSFDGIGWSVLPGANPLMNLHFDTPQPPALYARVTERTRIIHDDFDKRWVAFGGLGSTVWGDARGVALGQGGVQQGWPVNPDAVQMPAVLSPSQEELTSGSVYGDMTAWRQGSLWLGVVQRRHTTCPKTADAVLAASRDGRHWQLVRDEVMGGGPLTMFAPGGGDGSVETLMGGRPLASGGLWHFYAGGIASEPCADSASPGGIFLSTVRQGGLAGLQADTGEAVVLTKPLKLKKGVRGAALSLNARVDGKLLVQIEALSPIDTILTVAEKLVVAGDYVDQPLAMENLEDVTADRFRVRFTFTGGGELFGFRVSDPFCEPNPCDPESEKSLCEVQQGAAVCVCAPPLHDDGQGACTDDPCTPDPCMGPHQEGCTAEGGEAVCGCAEGWVKAGGQCVADPCLETGGEPVCPPPGPDRCRAVEGVAECYCPDGSEAGPTGCVETDARVFVTSQAKRPDKIGGLAGADAACASLAFAAGLPGTYKAWISGADESAASRLAGGGPWRTWDPEVGLWTKLVAKSAADLADGALSAPINYTEFNAEAPNTCAAWTGSTPAGALPPPIGPVAGTCEGWTSAQEGLKALAGRCASTDGEWTAAGPRDCSEKLSLYCFQMP